MKRIWIDTDIGTNPDDATALLFALKHPDLEVAGISVCGTQQEKRQQEANDLLEYCGEKNVEVFLGKDVEAHMIDSLSLDHTIAIGPLTNIARLILEEAKLGKLNIMGGAFSEVSYRGKTITTEKNVTTDQEATRIVLTQHDQVCISSLEATGGLYLEGTYKEQIEENHAFLKLRYDGYRQHLSDKFGQEHSHLILHDVLPVCDVLDVATINREVIEFYIQPDGSLRCPYSLPSTIGQIEEVTDNPDSLPVPLVKHEVIRSVDSSRILEEVTRVL